MKENILITIAIILAIVAGYYFSVEKNLGGGMEASRDCEITTTTAVSVGPNDSNTVLLATSGRSWARIQLVVDSRGNATGTPFLTFGDTAVVNNGIALGTSTPYMEFGMTTDFPYTGIVTAITDGTASTTLLLTECR